MGTERLYEEEPAKTLNLPTDVPAAEFLNLEGAQFSKSRGVAVWRARLYARLRRRPAALFPDGQMRPRCATPSSRGRDFVRRNNDELVATWGNLVTRASSDFTTNQCKILTAKIPQPGLMAQTECKCWRELSGLWAYWRSDCRVQVQAALGEIMALAREVNKYLDETAPWFQIKTDRRAPARRCKCAAGDDSLKVLFAPYLPFSSQQLHRCLGYPDNLSGQKSCAASR